MRARLVDWSLLALVLVEVASGLASFLEGQPAGHWLFVVHGSLGLAIILPLVWKLQRVWPRLVNRRHWGGATLASVLALAAVLLAIVSGVVWATWQWPLGYPNGMNLHVLFGLLLAAAVILHWLLRYKPLRVRDLAGRRTVLGGMAVLASGVLLWQGNQVVSHAAALPGARRRFTGSRQVGSGAGLAYPVTMWMLDNAPLVNRAGWQLRVYGSVVNPFTLTLAQLASAPAMEQTATLDCTGGWYTTQLWSGVPVSWLLDRAQVEPDASGVSFVAATGYRWSVPLAEARTLLLATHASGQQLNDGHGAPLRLVAPGRRGFQWVKWVTEVRVLNRPDLGQWSAIFTSGL